MGHITNSEREYRLLQQRLDYNLTGAPHSPAFIQILKLLFTPREAEIARQIPVRPILLRTLARKIAMPDDKLYEQVISMAERGLVFDFEHNGECYVVLAPVVIGFFEFVFMRTRGDLPLKELAGLFEQYMFKEDRFAHDVFAGQTQLGRSLAREESLSLEDYSEVLDWEKASSIIESSKTIGLSLCACRHKASHLGKSCDAPQQTCFTFNRSAEILIKKGMAEGTSAKQAAKILEQCKASGLAQIADNVQKDVGFMCNCCGCCCGMFQAIKTFNIRTAVVTSNWRADIDEESCISCGACVRACPVDAISLSNDKNNDRGAAVCERSLCLGCGVCYSACKLGCIKMKKREQQLFIPETAFDKYVAMAIERGKLSNLLFDDPTRLSHRALGRIAAGIEKSKPIKALMALRPVKSAFLSALATIKHKSGY